MAESLKRVSCANLVAIDSGILLVQETQRKHRGKYGLPGGGQKRRESLRECAERETQEETGLKTLSEELIDVYEGNGKLRFVYTAVIKDGALTTSRMHPDVGFFSEERVGEMYKQDQLRGEWVWEAVQAYQAKVAETLASLAFIQTLQAGEPIPGNLPVSQLVHS